MALDNECVLLCWVSFMLSVVYTECCTQALYAEYYYAEYHYAECHYTECHYDECHYAECRYAALAASFDKKDIK